MKRPINPFSFPSFSLSFDPREHLRIGFHAAAVQPETPSLQLSPFPLFYLIPVARHVCANKFLLYIENVSAALYVEDINNDGTAAGPAASLSLSPYLLVRKFNFDNARQKETLPFSLSLGFSFRLASFSRRRPLPFPFPSPFRR